MSMAWPELERRLAALDASTADWPVPEPGETAFRPRVAHVPADVAAGARRIADDTGEPSFVVWDLPRLQQHVRDLLSLLERHDIGLAVGLKACANRTVLGVLQDLGVFADAQSPGECALAQEVGFKTVTATGPAFGPAECERLAAAGVLLDLQSHTQLAQRARAGRREPFGVRTRLRLPEPLRHPATAHVTSRFGLPLTGDGIGALLDPPAPVCRVRVHSGEALSADVASTLDYRARVGVLLAEAFDGVDEINLGGGFLGLSREPAALAAALARVGAAVAAGRRSVGRPLTVWVEPGSALLLDSAYLVTQVLDVDAAGHAVTVAASPWNIAPWTFPVVDVLGAPGSDGEPWEFRGDVYGPALYENDRLRRTERHLPGGPVPRVGDRVAISAFGAYTLVHGRTFGQIPLPRQYVLDPDGYREAP